MMKINTWLSSILVTLTIGLLTGITEGMLDSPRNEYYLINENTVYDIKIDRYKLTMNHTTNSFAQ